MLYKQKFFIQTSQPPQEMRETSTVQLQCEDPFGVEENIVYEEKPFSIVSICCYSLDISSVRPVHHHKQAQRRYIRGLNEVQERVLRLCL